MFIRVNREHPSAVSFNIEAIMYFEPVDASSSRITFLNGRILIVELTFDALNALVFSREP